MLDDNINTATIYSKDDTYKIFYKFRNNLSNLLGTIKLNYNFYPGIQQNLDIIIKKIEELLLCLFNIDYPVIIDINSKNNENNGNININDNQKINKDINNLNKLNNINNKSNNTEIKLFELFYLFFTIETNSTFYELFLKFFAKFIKKLKKNNKQLVNLHLLKFQNYYFLLYNSLINKKFEFIGIQSDFNATLAIAMCLSLLVELFYAYKINIDKIKPRELFVFFNDINSNLFGLSKDKGYFTNEKFGEIMINTFNIILTDLSYTKDALSIVENVLDKIIIISKIKDNASNVSNKIDDNEESFHVDTLLLFLKLVCKILKNQELCKLFVYNQKLKLTKGLIELSFWDNPNIVDYTCKILLLIFKLSTSIENFGMRKEIEKLIDFIYLRHFKTYFNFLEDNKDNNEVDKSNRIIKLTVLEVLAKNFNIFIETNENLPLIYFMNDIFKIRFNIINEIFNSIQKYFNLNNKIYDYLQNTFIITYQIAFKKIFLFVNDNNKINNNNKNENNQIEQLISKIEEYSDFWFNKMKLIKEGNFKELLKSLCKEYNMQELKKNDKFEILSIDDKKKYESLAKCIAILIRYCNYVDIDNLFEIMAGNNPFSKLILNEYSKMYNFLGIDIIKAYNLFMSTFNLTGESYNIYNFICAFGSKYYEDNKEIYQKNKNNNSKEEVSFKSDEEVTSFAYAIMILNTDQHNPNVTNKMTLEQFIKNNKSSGLFSDVPEEYFKKIYEIIHTSGLKKANPRSENYSKDEETYLNLKSLESYLELHQELNIFINNNFFDVFKENKNQNEGEKFILTKENFPYLNLFNKISTHKNFHNNMNDLNQNYHWLNYSYITLYDELLPSVIALPGSFFENNTEMILNLLEKICDISLKLNRKEIIEKIIVCFNSLLNIKNKNINTYNLFFTIVLKYSQDFHTHLEMFYKAILDLLNFNLKEEENPLNIEYINIIEKLILKSYHVINSKRRNKNEGVGFFNLLIFGEGNNQRELAFGEYKEKIYKQLNIDTLYKSANLLRRSVHSADNLTSNNKKKTNNNNENLEMEKANSSSNVLSQKKLNPEFVDEEVNDNNNTNLDEEDIIDNNSSVLGEDEEIMAERLFDDLHKSKNITKNDEKIDDENNDLINITEVKINQINKAVNVKMILNKIKSQEEEFIFFVTFAASKILEYKSENEIFISLVFLNEILKDISEKEFGKIWPNLFNIFKSKMDFTKVDEDNIFELIFVNFFLTTIVKDYFYNILNEDYEQLLDTYEDIGSVELLLIILEYNDLFIKSAISHKKSLSPQNIESLIFLLYKLFIQLTKNLMNLRENNMLETNSGKMTINQITLAISLFNSIISSISSGDIITSDCLSRILNIIKLIYDSNLVIIFNEMNKEIVNISVLITVLSGKISLALDGNIKITSDKTNTENETEEKEESKETIITSSKETNDYFFSLFISLARFTLKCTLVENEENQRLFFGIMLEISKKSVPLDNYPKIINILSDWHQKFVELKIKYKNFWKDVFHLFYDLFTINPQVQTDTTKIENLWTLLIKKYMLSFTDEIKKKKLPTPKDEIEIIKKIYLIVVSIVKKITNTQKGLSWFESTKNLIKSYFPEILENQVK